MNPNGALPTEPESSAANDLTWVEEVAALLPEESRLGWYRNVRPWLRMLAPDDEIAHLAYSMGYLALLTRTTPVLIAGERAKLTALLQRHSDDVMGAVKTTADYHQKLSERLKKLPAEISQGLSPKALASEIADGVREQFLQSGIPEAGRVLKEQGDRLRQLVADQQRALASLQQQLNDSLSHARSALDSVRSGADAAKNSIEEWNNEMTRLQWLGQGLVLLLGLLLGALLYWWVIDPRQRPLPDHAAETRQSQAPVPLTGKRTPHAPK
jgi:chaperonin cofactor prefoldin